jgi:hypothetical protein
VADLPDADELVTYVDRWGVHTNCFEDEWSSTHRVPHGRCHQHQCPPHGSMIISEGYWGRSIRCPAGALSSSCRDSGALSASEQAIVSELLVASVVQPTKVEVVVISSHPWVVFIALTLLFLVMVTTLLILQRASKKRSSRDDPDITDADIEA